MSEQLVILPPNPRVHREALLDLLAKTFSQEGYFFMRELERGFYLGHSHYDWQTSRIGLLRGEPVTHFGVWGYDMRVGGGVLRTGGIGAVATHYDHRKRGLMAQTAAAAVAAMRARGYDVSLLFGIDNFYHKFGYTRAWAEIEYHLDIDDLPKVRPDHRAIPFAPRVRPELDDAFNRAYATVTGAAVRPTYRRSGFSLHQHAVGFRWREPDGVGYVILQRHGGRVVCLEAVGDPEQALRVIARQARAWGAREVVLRTIPYDSPLARRVRQGIYREERHSRPNGGAMIALLNLPTALEKLSGELTARLQASPLAGWRGTLRLDMGRACAALAIDGAVRAVPACETPHAVTGGDALAQLLIGTEAPREIARAHALRLSGDAALLLDALFPAQHPTLPAADRF